ncbi:MAG: lipoprotein insertase outer membrane protein LolB [Woeseiaceae bacterium]
MKTLFLLLTVLLLTACTTTPPHKKVANPEKEWAQRQVDLHEINHWVLNGRAAIINGEESWHLSMQWQFHQGKYILDLSGPFGAGHAQLTGTEEGVMLVDSDDNYYYADSPDRLLKEVTGVRMPVKSLLYWMRGLADYKIKQQQQSIDEFGRLAVLKQNGWRVRFKKYIEVDGHELPQKIFINGHDLKVKMFVDEWDLNTKKFVSVKE